MGPVSIASDQWAMLLALAVLWGGSLFLNGVAVRELPLFTPGWPALTAACRSSCSAAAGRGTMRGVDPQI